MPTSENARPFCIVRKHAHDGMTTQVDILVTGDSNPISRRIENFWKAVDDGKIKEITER